MRDIADRGEQGGMNHRHADTEERAARREHGDAIADAAAIAAGPL